MPFPSLIGGIPYPSDFVPSLIFAVAYGCLLPLVFYRFLDKESRTTVLIGSFVFAFERMIVFSFRAVQARNETKRFSEGLTVYVQTDLALGYIGIASDLVNLLRTLTIISTYGSDTYVQSTDAESRYRYWLSSGKLTDPEKFITKSTEREFPSKPIEGTPDNPKLRFWIRRGTDLLRISCLVSLVIGIVATTNFRAGIRDQAKADSNMKLRYASSGLALFNILWIMVAALWAYFALPRVNKRGCLTLFTFSLSVCVIAIYRLGVMHNTTDSLRSTAAGSLNRPGDKAAFYILHVLPEWVCIMLLFAFNTRKMFSTGMMGDWRSKDETQEERARREKTEVVHREAVKTRRQVKNGEHFDRYER